MKILRSDLRWIYRILEEELGPRDSLVEKLKDDLKHGRE